MYRRDVLAVTLGLLLVSCSDGDDPAGDGGKKGEAKELTFAATQDAIPKYEYDTGYLPAGSPIQVRLQLALAGGVDVKARGMATADTLEPVSGSGEFKLDARFVVKSSLKVDVAGITYEGPIPDAPNVELVFLGSQSFEPFLIGEKATVSVPVPEAEIARIPLAGALGAIPGVKGDLVIRALGQLDSSYSGVCAKAKSGTAQYTGSLSTGGNITLKPSVEISVPLAGSKKLDAFDIEVPIKAVASGMDLGSFASDGSGAASSKPCEDQPGSDSGPVADGGTPADGAADGGAGDLYTDDWSGLQDDYREPDAATFADQAVSVDAGCAWIGTVDNCSDCGDTCPTPANTTSTVAACEYPSCTIYCKGEEHYDVNGKEDDGCEVTDALAAHTTIDTAKDLGSAGDCGNAVTTAASLPSDNRAHVLSGDSWIKRSNGLTKYFKLAISDDGCNLNADATISLRQLPAGNTYVVITEYHCANSTDIFYDSGSMKGGTTRTFSPGTGCTLLGDDSGTLYVKVRKLMGTEHSNENFTISIEP